MNTTVLKPIKGRLLVSLPFLNDSFFGRSVVLLTEHNDQGSVGFILNKPFNTKIHNAIKDFPESGSKLYVGGPVENNSLFYLHTLGDLINDSIEIFKGLYWGGNFETIKLLISSEQIKSKDIKFFAGYSGWGPNQLQRELKEKSWVVSESTIKNIMDYNHENLWKEIVEKSGKENALWANYPINPSLN